MTREPETLADLIAPEAKTDPERIALIFEDRRITYAELDRLVEADANAFAALGVRHGDRVAMMFGNEPAFITAFYAVARLGAVAVPINPTYRHTEIGHILSDSEPVAALVEASLWTEVGESFAASGIPTFTRWDDPRRDGAPSVRRRPAPNDLAALVYTSGTTGKAKGAMHSHATLLANCRQTGSLLRRHARSDDRALTAIPLFHMYAIQSSMNAMFRVGGSIVLMRRFDAIGALEAIQHHRCTFLLGAPPMFRRWVAMPELRTYDLSSLRVITCGAAPLKASVLEEFRDATGVSVSESYGLTEAGPTSHSNSAGPVDKIGTVGPPIRDVESRLVDADGRDVPRGEPGEIVLRSPGVMLGYWRNPQATAETIRDGWLYTGDVAVADADDYYTIVDRLKDMLSVGGFKVWPLEVETALLDHPDIDDVAIVGLPDADLGERPMAFVVRATGSHVTSAEIVDYARGTLAKYKIPARIEFLETLPRNASGKILRRELRERARTLVTS